MKQYFCVIITLLLIPFQLLSEEVTNPAGGIKHTQRIMSVIEKEKDENDRARILEIADEIDTIYNNLYEKLTNKGKIVIFIDPAHGKLPNGEWQGAVTQRISTTGKPEEYYSIQLSRKLYSIFAANPYIEIQSTDDFMSVLKGNSDSYKNIPFSKTVELAKKNRAFIIISEHLNNVAVLYKASGLVNMPGIHITYDNFNRKVLQFVRGSYSGFLTLYNEFDPIGFSKKYAYDLKDNLQKFGFKPNSWDFGAVGDDRFSYFTDFPISVIFESGFISNPDDEKMLNDPVQQEIIAAAQYNSLLHTIKDVFGIDISSPQPVKVNELHPDTIDALKLSRIAVYYLGKCNTSRASSVIRLMEKELRKSKLKNYISYYSYVRNKVERADNFYNKGVVSIQKKSRRQAQNYFRLARRIVGYTPLFEGYKTKYGLIIRQNSENLPLTVTAKPAQPIITTPKAELFTKIILPVEENQTLEEALYIALEPDPETLEKLVKSVKNTRIIAWKKKQRYSGKNHMASFWRKTVQGISFKNGIYILQLNKNLKVMNAQYVNSVHLNPSMYQNQQLMKNSHFAFNEKEKSL